MDRYLGLAALRCEGFSQLIAGRLVPPGHTDSVLQRGNIGMVYRVSQLLAWEEISTSQIYIWLGLLIYVGIHKERKLRSHWKAPRLGDQSPLHSVIKFMPYWRFQLIHRYLRPFDHTKIDKNSPLLRVF
jgi:hypothetical protein